jgi:plastocyanin
MSTSRLAAGAAAAIAALLTAAGCGDTGDAASAEAPGGSCRTVTVSIGDFRFEPATIAVHRCDRVVWENDHDQAHTSTGQGDQTWSSGSLEPGERSEPVELRRDGTFAYVCALHPFMKGQVEVS